MLKKGVIKEGGFFVCVRVLSPLHQFEGEIHTRARTHTLTQPFSFSNINVWSLEVSGWGRGYANKSKSLQPHFAYIY